MNSQQVKSLALSGALVLAASSGAFAADLGPYQPYSPPRDEVRYDPAPIWQGAYIGVNGGYGWSNSALGEPDGGFGGGQLGYNWQRDRFVFGIEGDIQAADISGREFGGFGEARSDVDWFSTVRGRVGFASGPLLIYGTGGVAFADIDNRIDFAGPPAATIRDDSTHTGYAVGGGLEWAFAPNLSMKAEYLYLGFGDDTISNGAGAFARVNNDIQVTRVGLNYKF